MFNMGVGFVMVVSPSFEASIRAQLEGQNIESWKIGEIVSGEQGVSIS